MKFSSHNITLFRAGEPQAHWAQWWECHYRDSDECFGIVYLTAENLWATKDIYGRSHGHRYLDMFAAAQQMELGLGVYRSNPVAFPAAGVACEVAR